MHLVLLVLRPLPVPLLLGLLLLLWLKVVVVSLPGLPVDPTLSLLVTRTLPTVQVSHGHMPHCQTSICHTVKRAYTTLLVSYEKDLHVCRLLDALEP